ncbi:MAG: hypothetical protein LBP75_00530, partial [Planctomycetota bacterium]|nr:hypothetical protein [Planctomycetota bacterium]
YSPIENKLGFPLTDEEAVRDQRFFKIYVDEGRAWQKQAAASSPKNDAQIDIQIDIKESVNVTA